MQVGMAYTPRCTHCAEVLVRHYYTLVESRFEVCERCYGANARVCQGMHRETFVQCCHCMTVITTPEYWGLSTKDTEDVCLRCYAGGHQRTSDGAPLGKKAMWYD